MAQTYRVQLPSLHSSQQEVAQGAKRFNVLRCGRRWGKTTFGESVVCIPAIEGKPVGWFSPTYKDMAETWRRIARRLKPIISESNKTEGVMRLIGGGCIDFWSLDNPDSGRGRKYALVAVDEGSKIRHLEDAWQGALRPTLADYRGSAWFFGTPKGRNYFNQLYLKGQASEEGWASWCVGTAANPYIPKDEIEAAKRELPKAIFEQEFRGIPAPDGGNPFDLQAIRDCIVTGLQGTEADAPQVYGVDLAKSVDWTVVIGIDAAGYVISRARWQGVDWQAQVNKLGEICCDTPTLMDSTGVGDPIVEKLNETHPNIEGFKFTMPSKQELMRGLQMGIQQREIKIRATDEWLINELESMEYQYTPSGGVRYQAPDGLHDDGVMALALAYRHWKSGTPGFLRVGAVSTGDEWDDDLDDGFTWR